MIPWLIAISVFWLLTALYLGGMNLEIEGGSGVRQMLGLLTLFALFLAVWWTLGRVLALMSPALGPALGHVLLPTAISAALLPALARLAFRLFGVRIRRGDAHPAH